MVQNVKFCTTFKILICCVSLSLAIFFIFSISDRSTVLQFVTDTNEIRSISQDDKFVLLNLTSFLFSSCRDAQGIAHKVERGMIRKKIILLWTYFWGSKTFANNLFLCPDYPCILTRDRRQILDADAVLFHPQNFWRSDRPVLRKRTQKFIWATRENDLLTKHNQGVWYWPENYFNWTMTFRYDSDIVAPYGFAIPHPKTDKYFYSRHDLKKIVRMKSRAIAWFVSTCDSHSNRTGVALELAKHIDIDIYGDCPFMTHDCPVSRDRECDLLLKTKYFFYLSFENVLCANYTSEKLWDRIQMPVVPVALERSIVSPQLPKSAFIAVDDFPNIASLAQYLHSLVNDTEKYLRFFDWRQTATPFFFSENQKHMNLYKSKARDFGMCALCKKLWCEAHDSTTVNLTTWYSEARCHRNPMAN